MKSENFNRIAVKIGSNVLTCTDGTIDKNRMSALVNQIAELHKQGIEIILISSGAVASGRSEFHPQKKLDSVELRQLFSAIGQTKLIHTYYELFSKHKIACGQILTTKENFGTRRHYLNQKQCMEVMLEQKVIPIVNENDTISVTELMFTDNDELSGLIATMMNVDALIILSNIDGIYNGEPKDQASKIIQQIEPEQNLNQYIQNSKSSFGRGGMLTKCRIARKVAKEGIPVFIANGKTDDILLHLLAHKAICTCFLPDKKETSSVKKWIAHSEDFAKGKVIINQGACDALKTVGNSLLPIGIVNVVGNFQKHDIVKIIDEHGNEIGVGKAEYDSDKALSVTGKSHQRAFIHYDYMYLLQ